MLLYLAQADKELLGIYVISSVQAETLCISVNLRSCKSPCYISAISFEEIASGLGTFSISLCEDSFLFRNARKPNKQLKRQEFILLDFNREIRHMHYDRSRIKLRFSESKQAHYLWFVFVIFFFFNLV